MSPPQQPGRRESYHSTSSGPTGGGYTLSTQSQIPTINQPPSMEGSPSAMTYEMYQSPRTASPNPVYHLGQALTTHLPTLTIPENPGLLAPDVSPWASSESNFSTPSEHSHRKSFAPRGGYGSPTTTADWALSTYVPAAFPTTAQDLRSPADLELMAASAAPSFTSPWSSAPYTDAMIDPAMSIYYEDNSILNHSHPHFPSVRSPTPPNISSSVQSAESLVTLAPALRDAQAHVGRFKEQAALLGTLSGASFLTAITLPRPVRNAIPDLLEVYWKRFDTFFPLVHRRSFEAAPNDVLRCAMAAMATQFLDSKEDRLRGNTLHEFAWQEVKRVSWPRDAHPVQRQICFNQSLQVPQWNVQIMQAILLCEFFARFRGRKAVIRPSQPFQSLYSRVSSLASPTCLSPDFVIYSSFFQDPLFSLVLSSPFSQWHPYSTSPSQVDTTQDHESSFGSTMTTSSSSAGAPASGTLRGRWAEWLEAEARRRLLAACFVLDAHTSVYYELPLMQPFNQPCPPIPLTATSQTLWEATTPEEWEARIPTGLISLEPAVLMEGVVTPERIASAPSLDQAVFLASESLRMPRRSSFSGLDLSSPPDLTEVERITQFFPGSATANTYAALHYTPLHDLLAVSGDSWLFSQKVLPSLSFQQHQKRLKRWSASPHASVAAQLAAKALIAFISDNSNTNTTPPALPASRKSWNTNNISDYWALYVCSLICWALGYQATRGTAAAAAAAAAAASTPRTASVSSPLKTSSSSSSSGSLDPESSDAEVLSWLAMVAGGSAAADVPGHVKVRGRGAIVAVVALARRRIEAEAVGGRSRLLVDAVGVLRKLEEGANWKWF
jgi:hypothetical protein